MTELRCTVAGLSLYPVKSCAGLGVASARLCATGLQHDREWMVVDTQGRFLSQRELPRMALIHCTFKGGELGLRAPGMLPLHLSLAAPELATRTRVQVWGDVVKALDLGDLAALWLSNFLGRPARLVRFDAAEQRLSDQRWTGELEAPNLFSDGFPLLVVSQASLNELNRRLARDGLAPVGMARFRPNLVLEGLEAHDEDHVQTLTVAGDSGPITLRLVKPCARCTIPDVDPADASTGHAVADELARYRSDPRVNGAATFGMNAVLLDGAEQTLRVGQTASARLGF